MAEEAGDAPAAKSAVKLILKDKNILTLALTSCFFEGSLFLFIFFKFPALKLCHELSGSTAGKLSNCFWVISERLIIVQICHSVSSSLSSCAP